MWRGSVCTTGRETSSFDMGALYLHERTPIPHPRSALSAPFWKKKSLEAMSPDEWESLCDGCGRCCLVKLEEEETEKTHFTDVACFMLDCDSCLCSDYQDRKRHVPDCVTLTP